jgi:hypothetical protein
MLRIVELNTVTRKLDCLSKLRRTKGIAMGLSVSKAKSISGIALISAIVVGCGGGGGGTAVGGTPAGGSPPGGAAKTEGSVTCAATDGAQALTALSDPFLLGSCEQYEASIVPTKASTAFRSPGVLLPVTFNVSSGYKVSVPLVSGADVVIPLSNLLTLPGGTVVNSFGNFAGKTYQTILDQTTGGAAYAYDLKNATTLDGRKYLDLNFSRFGMFSRFGTRTLGYYGGWIQGDQVGNLPTGLVTFKGIVVGVIGPGAGGTSVGTAAGFSADVLITVDFAALGAPVTSLEIKGFGYSANGTQILPVQVAPGGVVKGSSLDMGTKSLSASFITSPAASASDITVGRLIGNFYGESAKDATEFVGTFNFRTADGRNAAGSFGVRSGTSTVNP